MFLNQLEKVRRYWFAGDVIENLMQTLLEPSVKRLVTRFFGRWSGGRNRWFMLGHDSGLRRGAAHRGIVFSHSLNGAAAIPSVARQLD